MKQLKWNHINNEEDLIKQFFTDRVLVCILISFSAQKKTSSTPEERAGKLTEWMKTNLQLS